jgi:hypothetical protein
VRFRRPFSLGAIASLFVSMLGYLGIAACRDRACTAAAVDVQQLPSQLVWTTNGAYNQIVTGTFNLGTVVPSEQMRHSIEGWLKVPSGRVDPRSG